MRFEHRQKTYNRAMAGEYSRELSQSVCRTVRLIKLGFKHGGFRDDGLGQKVLDERGVPKGHLPPRSAKSLQTDRVILTPGTPSVSRPSGAFSEVRVDTKNRSI